MDERYNQGDLVAIDKQEGKRFVGRGIIVRILPKDLYTLELTQVDDQHTGYPEKKVGQTFAVNGRWLTSTASFRIGDCVEIKKSDLIASGIVSRIVDEKRFEITLDFVDEKKSSFPPKKVGEKLVMHKNWIRLSDLSIDLGKRSKE